MTETQRPTVLIADDSELNREILYEFLVDDYSVAQAANGQQALETARQRHPDIILMDLSMPIMDGITACHKLKEDPATASIPVIFVTGNNDPLDREQAKAAGAADFIIKPFDTKKLRHCIKRHLRSPQDPMPR